MLPWDERDWWHDEGRDLTRRNARAVRPMNTILTSAMVDFPMPQAATNEQAAPCPVCNSDMVLAAITPHPIALQLARNTYLCVKCNQTKTYILPHQESDGSPNGSEAVGNVAPHERRRAARETLDTPATIYDKNGSFLLP